MKNRIKSAILALALVGASVLTCYAAVYEWPNVGLDVHTETVLYGAKKDEAIYFSPADLEFKFGLQEGELAGITVLSLPKESEGTLLFDGEKVQPNDRLTRTQINDLSFVPAKDAAQAAFTLLPEASDSVKTTLSLNLYENDNLPPTAESGKISTFKNMPVQGTVTVTDPENDQIMIKVIDGPEKGDIEFSGASFTYEPFYGMTGADELTFVCVDKQGNYSKKSTLSIDIEKERTAISYADMASNPSHYSAVKLNEKGIYTGEKSGDRYFFHPDRQVSRGMFLVNLISAMGLEDGLTACVNTGMQNDGEIDLFLKPYVKLAIDKKILLEKQFQADQILTRSEAVVLIDRAVNIPKVKTAALPYKDRTDVPSWALQSYMNLDAYKMLDFYDGLMKPKAALTNDHMADLLWQVWKYEDMTRK